MLTKISDWLGSGDFMPHGYCYLWQPALLWTEVVSDLITAASYLSIPFALWFFAHRRPDIRFRGVFVMFGVFVLACGATHLFAAWNIWHADYWMEAVAKAITAAASLATAVLLWRVMPEVLALPSPAQLVRANAELRTEAARREMAETALTAVNQNLERRVNARTVELARANAELRASEARFRSLTEMSSDFYWETDAEHRLTARGSTGDKPSKVAAFRYGAQIGLRRWEIPHLSPDASAWEAHRADLDARRPFRNFELSRRAIDGSVHHLAISGDPVFDSSGNFQGYRGVGTEITERKLAEAKIRRLTQLYATLSLCNEAIVRCADPQELFDRICRIAVESGGMQLAWIGMVDAGSGMIRVVASFGEGAVEYVRNISISVDAASPYGQGPSAIAVRENHPVWLQNFQSEPHTAPWHEQRARFGWGASATLPLRRKQAPAGVFTLYAAQAGAFDEDERRLLLEMATDLSFALDNFEREAQRERAQRKLREAEVQFRGLVEQSIAGIYIIQDGRLAYANPRCAEIIGLDSDQALVGSDPLDWVAAPDRAGVAERLLALAAGEIRQISHDFGVVRRDGTVIQVGASSAHAAHKGRPAVIGMLQDISDKKRAEQEIQRYISRLKLAFMSTVEVATALSELRDPYTAGHERRVGEIAAAIGAKLGLDPERVEGLRIAGYLHDIGKITIPAEILSKPGRLSALEYELIRTHVRAGYDVLKQVEFPWPVAQIVLQHHERIDGSGYPSGLKGEDILPDARILAVADVIESMSSHRPYRPALGVGPALEEIGRGRGRLYDAAVVDACLKLFAEDNYVVPS